MNLWIHSASSTSHHCVKSSLALISVLVSLCLSLTGCPDPTGTGEVVELGGEAAGETAGSPAGVDAGDQSGDDAGDTAGDDLPELRGLGDPCASAAQCESGICFSVGVSDEGICTSPCDGEGDPCPLDGFACVSTASFGFVCVPADPKTPCEPCEQSWECGSETDYCVFFAEEGSRHCTSSCDDDAECPAGYSCIFFGGENNQCFPDNGLNQCDVIDTDDDGVTDDQDNCPRLANPDQADADGDGYGDICDTCPELENPDQLDGDSDGYGDLCDACPDIANDTLPTDQDSDGYGDSCDNCPNTPNPAQIDTNGDGVGDACEVTPEARFTMGTTVGAAGAASSAQYTLMGGLFGVQRASILRGANYQMRPFPTP